MDTTFLLSKEVNLSVFRNPDYYGNIHFRLWNPYTEQTAANTEVIIDGHQVMSDAQGMVNFSIPLADQKTVYSVSATSIKLLDQAVYPPFGPYDAMQFK